MISYKSFRNTPLELSSIGLELGEPHSDYFCAPKGARVIGWTGVDGIHYCQVSRLGERVFCVDPMAEPGCHVLPVAKNLREFLRLVLACGGEAAISQAHRWTQEAFDAFLKENPPTEEQRAALERLRKAYRLTPMKDPYTYICRLQSGFDPREIPFREEYYDLVPDAVREPIWEVYYGGNFWSRRKEREQSGKAIRIEKTFSWGGKTWLVPAVYVCSKGLVMDLCTQVEPETFRPFVEKWFPWEGREEGMSRELQEQAEAENPLKMEFHAALICNGRELRQKSGCGTGWIPESCAWEGWQNEPEAQSFLEHYGLDKEKVWSFRRLSFPWATKRRPASLRSLTLQLRQHPVSVPGPHFCGVKPGETVPFTHPIDGKEYTLTVLEVEEQELPESAFHDPNLVYPRRCVAMGFTLAPELPRDAVQVQDCAQGDRPRPKFQDPNGPVASHCAMAVGAVIRMGREGEPYTTASSLYFDLPEEIEWRIVLRQKTTEDLETSLI